MEAKPFSPFDVPLEGAQLIEASAGTGKTYTITSLFLRLVLEGPLDVRSILVVTFTEAATAELRDRVRNRLRAAHDAFAAGSAPPGDDFLAGLLSRHGREQAEPLLRQALADFDEAAIFTIHGFCRRVLHDMAFEAGGLFDTELITSQDDLVQRAVDDYWRRTIARQSRLFAAYCLQENLSADSLYALVAPHIGKPGLAVVPQEPMVDYEAAEKSFLQDIDRIRRLWERSRQEVLEILSESTLLNHRTYRKDYVAGWAGQLDAWLAAGRPVLPLFAKADRFTNNSLQQAAKKDGPPAHSFFDAFSDFYAGVLALEDLYRRHALAIRATALQEVARDLEKRKQAQNIRYFDDLLLGVYRGLTGPGAERLAAAVRARFAAALIDEFQDTDPVQYAIFEKVFLHPASALFLIGDPKQAIYSFRNADIYAYLHAAGQVRLRHHLATNYRSDPQLIRAVNTLFGRCRAPFLLKDIDFMPAAAAPDRQADTAGPPFELWFVPQAEHEDLSAGQVRRSLAACTAAEIARLIGGGEQPGAIAVLVRTHDQADMVQRELARRRVPCIRQSTQTVFDTPEAEELELVLRAVAEPSAERRMRTALATPLLGLDAAMLYDLQEQASPEYEAHVARFADYQDLWRRHGCFAMLRSLFRQESVIERLVVLPQGERRVTNLLHLSEVLHRQEAQAAPGMEGLVDWLAVQRNPASPRLEEHQLRLESDDDAVRIVTIHKSKGLEYPVVFCPFSWGGASAPGSKVAFHDPAAKNRLTLDIGSPDLEAHKLLAAREALAEDARLLYVALTRAKRRCHLVWGAFEGAPSSALALLLHGGDIDLQDDMAALMKERMDALDDDDLKRELAALEAAADGALAVRDITLAEAPAQQIAPAAGPQPPLAEPRFSGTIIRAWRMASFSSLIAGRPHEQEFPQTDEFCVPAEPVTDSSERSPRTLPAGARTGTMLHTILEKTDFVDPAGLAARSLVQECLGQFGFAPEWRDVVLGMVGAAAAARLRANGADFMLGEVPAQERTAELGFYFPLQPLSREALARLFAGAGLPACAEAVGELVFSPVAGYMNGFIDLVICHEGRYYLIDWKSNFLGPDPGDYAAERLDAAMRDNFYFLQYHLYALALHRHLALRQPGYSYEQHFGGAFYLFLRGLDPQAPENGIFFDRPAFGLIQAMDETLIAR